MVRDLSMPGEGTIQSKTAPRDAAEIPRNGAHQGIPIPRPRRHNYKNFMKDGGPARTRTWDQGIMSPLL